MGEWVQKHRVLQPGSPSRKSEPTAWNKLGVQVPPSWDPSLCLWWIFSSSLSCCGVTGQAPDTREVLRRQWTPPGILGCLFFLLFLEQASTQAKRGGSRGALRGTMKQGSPELRTPSSLTCWSVMGRGSGQVPHIQTLYQHVPSTSDWTGQALVMPDSMQAQ